MNIFICEDDPKQRERLENIVNEQISSTDLDMEIALSTQSPTALLEYLESHQVQSGLYFLDVDLQCDINGIELGAKIRNADIFATIVFVTTHSEMTPLVFTYKVQALDYIIKDDPPQEIAKRIVECIQIAYKHCLSDRRENTKYYVINIGKQTLSVPYDSILYFESCVDQRNKLVLHTVDNMLSFRGHISAVSKLGSPFCMCHQSYVVNVDNIRNVDKENRLIEMISGETVIISRRRMTELIQCMGMKA